MKRPEFPPPTEESIEPEPFLGGKPAVIAVDGRVGAGKGTTARIIAEWYGYRHLEAGSLFRGAAVAAIDAGVPIEDAHTLTEFVDSLDIVTVDEYGLSRTVVNGIDVTDRIGLPGIGECSTQISLNERASLSLINKVIDFAKAGNAVIDGRGVGTEEVPGAGLKLFLTASLAVRARRRHRQFMKLGLPNPPELEEVRAEVNRRDVAEINRTYSPLRPAADAIIINTESCTPDEVVRVSVASYNARQRLR